ncbi:hypothetical protein ACNUDN_11710 [Mycobacterium sp. smrl_JER01]|uniref:hypothetical protein n=1 Tax=Mycobacterium sp. smrl_JER01 TaxID=3402633 RepID=UPI003AC86C4F
MADIAEAFKQHLRSLSDSEWDALASEVRSTQNGRGPEFDSGQRIEVKNEASSSRRPAQIAGVRQGSKKYDGLLGAYLKGYIDIDGNPTKGA